MTRLHVLREGQGPTLLLLHGIGSSATAWSKQMERLGGDFTCLAPDLPGYGESPDATDSGLDAIVAEVAAVLDGQPAHVLGVSFGALTALSLARNRPDLVTSLVLADATLGRAYLPVEERQRWLRNREGLANDLATRSVERAGEIAGPDATPAVIQEIALHMRRALFRLHGRREGHRRNRRATVAGRHRPADAPPMWRGRSRDRDRRLEDSRRPTSERQPGGHSGSWARPPYRTSRSLCTCGARVSSARVVQRLT
jgi:pimeloyl-ACP methyl ester carboxylesterase